MNICHKIIKFRNVIIPSCRLALAISFHGSVQDVTGAQVRPAVGRRARFSRFLITLFRPNKILGYGFEDLVNIVARAGGSFKNAGFVRNDLRKVRDGVIVDLTLPFILFHHVEFSPAQINSTALLVLLKLVYPKPHTVKGLLVGYIIAYNGGGCPAVVNPAHGLVALASRGIPNTKGYTSVIDADLTRSECSTDGALVRCRVAEPSIV